MQNDFYKIRIWPVFIAVHFQNHQTGWERLFEFRGRRTPNYHQFCESTVEILGLRDESCISFELNIEILSFIYWREGCHAPDKFPCILLVFNRFSIIWSHQNPRCSLQQLSFFGCLSSEDRKQYNFSCYFTRFVRLFVRFFHSIIQIFSRASPFLRSMLDFSMNIADARLLQLHSHGICPVKIIQFCSKRNYTGEKKSLHQSISVQLSIYSREQVCRCCWCQCCCFGCLFYVLFYISVQLLSPYAAFFCCCCCSRAGKISSAAFGLRYIFAFKSINVDLLRSNSSCRWRRRHGHCRRCCYSVRVFT